MIHRDVMVAGNVGKFMGFLQFFMGKLQIYIFPCFSYFG